MAFSKILQIIHVPLISTDPMGLRSPKPSKKKIKKQLEKRMKGLEKMRKELHKLCKKSCYRKKDASVDDCKKEADDFINKVKATFEANFWNPNWPPTFNVGGYACYEWAKAFMAILDAGKYNYLSGKTMISRFGAGGNHWKVELTVGGEGSTTRVFMDDGRYDANFFSYNSQGGQYDEPKKNYDTRPHMNPVTNLEEEEDDEE